MVRPQALAFVGLISPHHSPISTTRPILFEAALAQRTCFSLDSEGEATLKLIVPAQFAKVLGDHIGRLLNTSFVVAITVP